MTPSQRKYAVKRDMKGRFSMNKGNSTTPRIKNKEIGNNTYTHSKQYLKNHFTKKLVTTPSVKPTQSKIVAAPPSVKYVKHATRKYVSKDKGHSMYDEARKKRLDNAKKRQA